MPITVFLDIDGVLNSTSSEFYGLHVLRSGMISNPDPISVSLVDYFVKLSDAQIVISSSWRKLYTVNELKLILKDEFKFLEYDRVIGKTDSEGKLRGEEIQRYIDANNIVEYVIFDDDSDMLESQKPHFVHTKGHYGFSVFDLEEACKIAKVEMVPHD